MQRKLLSALLAIACVGALAVPVLAEPVLSEESSASALCKIYNYQVGTSNRWNKTGFTSDVRTDTVFCTVVERVCDDSGNIYRLTDSSPLTEQFSRRTTIGIGAPYVSGISPADYDADGFTGSSFQIKLNRDYSGQSTAVEFENVYTAKEDITLKVYSVTDKADTELLVKKGAKLTSQCRIMLNERSIDVTKYPESTPEYQSLLPTK